MTDRILFVCMGNICRSPLAEAILRRQAVQAGLDLYIDSAGTGGWHVGDAPDDRAITAAHARGMDITAQKARMFTSEDFSTFEFIVALDRNNLHDIRLMEPADSQANVALLSSYRAAEGPKDIPDPYYTGQFNCVIDMLEDCVAGLVAQLKSKQ